MTARTQPGPAADAPWSRAGHLAVVAAPVELDHATAAWLLRWCEAWLHRLDVGEADLAHLLIDVSHTRRAAPSGLALLEQARTEAGRRGVGIHLVGAGVLVAASSLQVRRFLGRWSTFPHVEAARRVWLRSMSRCARCASPTSSRCSHASHHRSNRAAVAWSSSTGAATTARSPARDHGASAVGPGWEGAVIPACRAVGVVAVACRFRCSR